MQAAKLPPMKIIEITNVDFSLRQFLLPLMRGARARGHDVVGACAEGPLLGSVRTEGFRVLPVPFERRVSPLAHVQALTALVRMFRNEHPDLVHAHMPISGLLARAAARLAGVPRIAYTCHGFLFNQPGPFVRRAVSLAAEWGAGRFTDIFFTVSGEEAKDARRLGLACNPIAIGNGRDPDVFRPDAERRAWVRSALGIPEDRPVIIAVSRLVRAKGYPELAEAMTRLPEAELWVVGERLSSDRGPDMCAVLRNAGLGGRLRLLGYRDDVPALMSAADIFALPSHFEGLPMSVIEAMLSGLPVVASDIRGVQEQVVSDKTGLLVPAGDAKALRNAITQLTADAALRTRMGLAGRERAMTLFTEAKVVDRTLDALGL